MRRILALAAVLATTTSLAARSEPTTTKHLSVTTSATAASDAPVTRVSLVIDVTLKPEMHVYAPGQKDFIPISLTLTPVEGLKQEPVRFPDAEKLELRDLGQTHLVYSKPFRIVQDVTLSRTAAGKRPGAVTVKGRLKYQACDNSICYAPVTVPVTWTLPVTP